MFRIILCHLGFHNWNYSVGIDLAIKPDTTTICTIRNCKREKCSKHKTVEILNFDINKLTKKNNSE